MKNKRLKEPNKTKKVKKKDIDLLNTIHTLVVAAKALRRLGKLFK